MSYVVVLCLGMVVGAFLMWVGLDTLDDVRWDREHLPPSAKEPDARRHARG